MQHMFQSYIRNGQEDNKFLELFYSIYEAVYYPKTTLVHSWKRKFNKPFAVNLDLLELINEINEFTEEIATTTPTWQSLYDFGTFIKILEKIFMYRNDKDAMVVCDSSLEEKKRHIVIHTESAFISMTLLHVEGKNIIDFLIRREFGKKMETRYNIVNTNMDFSSVDDLMNIANMNQTLQMVMASFFAYWCNLAVMKRLAEYTLRPQDFKPFNISKHTVIYTSRELEKMQFNGYTDEYWAFCHMDDIHIYNQTES